MDPCNEREEEDIAPWDAGRPLATEAEKSALNPGGQTATGVGLAAITCAGLILATQIHALTPPQLLTSTTAAVAVVAVASIVGVLRSRGLGPLPSQLATTIAWWRYTGGRAQGGIWARKHGDWPKRIAEDARRYASAPVDLHIPWRGDLAARVPLWATRGIQAPMWVLYVVPLAVITGATALVNPAIAVLVLAVGYGVALTRVYLPAATIRINRTITWIEVVKDAMAWTPDWLMSPFACMGLTGDPRNPKGVWLRCTNRKSETTKLGEDVLSSVHGKADLGVWTATVEESELRGELVRVVRLRPARPIPTRADYPEPTAVYDQPWDKVPLGVARDGSTVVWDLVAAPHFLAAGVTGGGKSVLQRTVMMHAMRSPHWRVVCIDRKRVEMANFRGKQNVLKVAVELEDALSVLRSAEAEMHRRYHEMEDAGHTKFKEFKPDAPALLIVVDELTELLEMEKLKDEEGKERDLIRTQCTYIINSIARLGRAAAVHMLLATQRPDATILPGATKNNLDARCAVGRLDLTPSMMILDSDLATKTPKIPGRSLLRQCGEHVEFQGYWIAPADIDKYLPKSTEPPHSPAPPALEPGPVPA